MFLDTLSADARQLLIRLGRQPLLRTFYLAGGSAAALHMGHRISVVLDFFTQQDHYETEPLIQHLQTIAHLEIQQQNRGTLVGRLGDVRISFFVYPYPLLAEPEELEGCRVAQLLDIALMKLIAISQRGTKRDFVDLFFICQKDYNLGELLRQIPLKYTTVSYPAYHILRALVYFFDADEDESPQMLATFYWDQAKRFFEDQVKQLTRDL
jgi:hypothetical protein